jgi:8-oxo-dGTP diphosphatase
MCAKINDEINYCLRCAHALETVQKFGAQRPVCPECGWIYFADPKVAVAALIIHAGQVLLVRRANDPLRGLWTLPAGFIDAGEDPEFALVRECSEETGLDVHIDRLLDVISGKEHPRGANILIAYQASILSGDLHADDDVDNAAFFPPDALPALAFSTTKRILKIWASGGYQENKSSYPIAPEN